MADARQDGFQTGFSSSAGGATAGDLFDSLRLELRRGSLILAVLAQLRAEHYGYTLRKALAESSLEIEESTLYPLLRRLESQGLLTSQWREEAQRNKRFYRLSAEGIRVLGLLEAEWRQINGAVGRILYSPAAGADPSGEAGSKADIAVSGPETESPEVSSFTEARR